MGKGITVITYCRKSYKNHNRRGANLLKKELSQTGKLCALKSFSELLDMAIYLKIENPDALGIIAFRSGGKIMSEGIDIIEKNELYIKSAFSIYARGDSKKDYFIVSSRPLRVFKPKREGWRTLLIAEDVGCKDLITIDGLLSELEFDSKNFESRCDKKKFYVEVHHHSFYLKGLLKKFQEAVIKVATVGSYKIKSKTTKKKRKGKNENKKEKEKRVLGSGGYI